MPLLMFNLCKGKWVSRVSIPQTVTGDDPGPKALLFLWNIKNEALGEQRDQPMLTLFLVTL